MSDINLNPSSVENGKTIDSNRRLRQRNRPTSTLVPQKGDEEHSSSDNDGNMKTDDGLPSANRVVRKRKKRKLIRLDSTVPGKLPRLSDGCCIHMDDSRMKPVRITDQTRKKILEVINLLKPLDENQLAMVSPQAKIIFEKLQRISLETDSYLEACKKCQDTVKKNFTRYQNKINEMNLITSVVTEDTCAPSM